MLYDCFSHVASLIFPQKTNLQKKLATEINELFNNAFKKCLRIFFKYIFFSNIYYYTGTSGTKKHLTGRAKQQGEGFR